MHQRLAFILVLLFSRVTDFAQPDSVIYSPEVRMEDAIYLSYQDFRYYQGIKKQQIISKLDKNQLEFLSKVVFEDKFSFEENGKVVSVPSKNAWGYVQNNTLYVNYKGDFYRVPVFGSVSYLVANVTVVTPGFYDPRFGMSTGPSTTKEIHEFLMNFYDGILKEFNQDTAEQLLARDKTLFDEYQKLSRRKQHEQIYGYIRKYNALHPIYFLRA